jgi:membrane fusion protein, multidrug efflux system
MAYAGTILPLSLGRRPITEFPMKRIMLFALVPCLLMACGKSEAPPPPAPQVYTVTVKPQSVALTRQFVGRVSSYQSANVVARVSGVLLDRLYHEGGAVRRGQRLFQIDPAYYQAQLDADQAILAQDRATLDDARLTSERTHKLLPVGSVSQQTVDNADAARNSAAAKVKADEAQIEAARLNLSYTQVTAPIDGIAGQQQVTTGTVVGSGINDNGAGGTLLTTIERIDPVYVNFTISATDLIALRQAQTRGKVALTSQNATKVRIELPNGETYSHDGTLDFSGVLVSATTGALNMRASVANPSQVLLPGMYITLRVDLGRQKGVFLVPQQALLRDSAGAYVLIVDNGGKVARKNVASRDADGSNWIVTNGLADGDRVIVSGLQKAREGQAVNASGWRPPDQAGSGATGVRQ